MTEKEFQSQVIILARLYGWKVAHFEAGRARSGRWITPVVADGAGFPDLVMVHPVRRLLVLPELKTDVGRMRPEQVKWAQWLATVSSERVISCVWRPSDWDTIQKLIVGE